MKNPFSGVLSKGEERLVSTWEWMVNGNKNTKYIFIAPATYIMSPFNFVHAGMCRDDAIKVDVSAFSNRFRI